MNADERFWELEREFISKLFEKDPLIATILGKHQPYDWYLPDGGGELHRWLVQLLSETLEKGMQLNHDELSDDVRRELKALEYLYKLEKFNFEDHQKWKKNPEPFSYLSSVLLLMLTRDYAPIEERIAAITSRLKEVPRYLKQFKTRFQNSRPVKLWTKLAIEIAKHQIVFLEAILAATRGRVSQQKLNDLEHAIETTTTAIADYIDWLEHQLPIAVEEWPLGKEKFAKLMTIRNLGLSINEIQELGWKYLHSLKRERARLAKQIALNLSEADVIHRIESHHPASFKEALAFIRQQLKQAREFIIAHDLATIPEGDELRVEETPAFLAPLFPFGALFHPAKYDSRQIGTYIVTRPEPQNLGKHLNYADIPGIVVHEGYPGHYLQLFASNKKGIFSVLTGSPETVEGWAHFCEQMMEEQGFLQSIESQLMAVNAMIFRAVRIIVDVELSQGVMTFDKAVNMLMTEVGMSKESALAEVHRYTQNPGYQLSYLVGRHLITTLRELIKRKLGEKYSDKFFHDFVIFNGNLPFYILKEELEMEIERRIRIAL
ncbi:MAG: DUF885 domain-containing protein [Candidatus Hodarchaeota archaeon]